MYEKLPLSLVGTFPLENFLFKEKFFILNKSLANGWDIDKQDSTYGTNCINLTIKGNDNNIERVGNPSKLITITKGIDEWYYVSIFVWSFKTRENGSYYRCDQWDGLLAFLEKEFNF